MVPVQNHYQATLAVSRLFRQTGATKLFYNTCRRTEFGGQWNPRGHRLEISMKVIIATLALALATAAPAAAKMCVQSRDITSANSKDGKLMTFKMRDGRVLVNHLQGN